MTPPLRHARPLLAAAPATKLVAVLTVLSVLAGCAPVTARHETAPDADLARVETYAWRGSADDEEAARFERTVDAGFAARGLRRVPVEDAELLARQELAVEERLIEKDPYFAHYVAEQVEFGTYTLTLSDARSDRGAGGELWRGEATARLRTTAHATGPGVLRFRETEEVRDWPVESLVEAVLGGFPRR